MLSLCFTSRSSYIRHSKSCAEMPPMMITRAESPRKCMRRVALQERRVLREDRALRRVVDVRLERHDAGRLHDAEQLIHHHQQVGEVLLARRGREQPLDLRDDRVDERHRRADDQDADRGAADDEELGRLPQQDEVAAVPEIPAGNGAR